MAEQGAELPRWLAEPPAYDPPSDRDGFLRRNLLALTGMLRVFRTPACPAGPIDAALARVSPVLRLLGVIASVACVTSARNMAFVWVMLALVLVMLAARPARRIAAVLRPALLVAGFALLVNIPAAFMGNPSAPLRTAVKCLVTTTLVLGLANGVQTERLFGALATLHVPSHVVLVCDLAVRDLALLGQVAANLAEALALRCVGKNRDKTASAAGVMGMTFLKSNDLARQQSEAMACRGFDGSFELEREPVLSAPGIVYALCIAAVVAAFFYFEGALA